MKAILVDDEPDGIRTLKKMLEIHCPHVDVEASCFNAIMAKQLIEQLHPDVVFLIYKCLARTGWNSLQNCL